MPKNAFVGMILRVDKRQETADFYAKLGLKFSEHRHDQGPMHHECTNFVDRPAMELYTRSKKFNFNTIMIQVESLEQALNDLATAYHLPWMVQTKDGIAFAYVKDPDGNNVMLLEYRDDNH